MTGAIGLLLGGGRWRYLLGLIVGGALLPMLPVSGLRGGPAARSAAGAAILDERTPGHRPAGALFQTKPGYRTVPGAPRGPQQRVLSTVRDRPVIPGLVFAPPVIASGVPPVGSVLPPLLPAVFAPGPLTSPPLIDSPILTGPNPPVGGGPITPGNPDTPAPPVPEPAAWATMIGGLAILGVSLRRQRRQIAIRT